MHVCMPACMSNIQCVCCTSTVIMYNYIILKGCMRAFMLLYCIMVLYYSVALCEVLRMYMDLCHANTILID